MIEPALSDEAFLADLRSAPARKEELHCWWLGQSGFLLQWNGRRLLLDPYLSDSLTRKYAGTDKPHVRMTARVVDPERLEGIDLVTSSHNHTDHLDAETLKPILRTNPRARLVIAEANRPFVAERLGCDPAWPIGCDDGKSVEVAPWILTGVASAHETLERDERGHARFLGYLVRVGPFTLYHPGDTIRYDGMVEAILARIPAGRPLDLAFLPINGRAPERRVAGNLTGQEAARLAKDLGARLAIPCHHEMFEFNSASPEEFLAEAKRLGQKARALRAGERWTIGRIEDGAGVKSE